VRVVRRGGPGRVATGLAKALETQAGTASMPPFWRAPRLVEPPRVVRSRPVLQATVVIQP
jgi:hypothetical protein